MCYFARLHREEGALTALLRGLHSLARVHYGGDGQRRMLEAVKLVPVKMEMETLKCKLAMSSANGSTHASSQKENGKPESQRDHRETWAMNCLRSCRKNASENLLNTKNTRQNNSQCAKWES